MYINGVEVESMQGTSTIHQNDKTAQLDRIPRKACSAKCYTPWEREAVTKSVLNYARI